jgi:hypothetical protein
MADASIALVPLPRWGYLGRRFAGAGRCGRLAGHESIAAAIAGDTQPERLDFFFDTQSQGRVFDGRVGLNLPPFAIFAESPGTVAVDFLHDFAPQYRVRLARAQVSNDYARLWAGRRSFQRLTLGLRCPRRG